MTTAPPGTPQPPRELNPPHLTQSSPANPVVQLREFLRALHVMKMYCAAEGIAIPKETGELLAGLAPVEAALARQAAGDQTSLPEAINLTEDIARAIVAHGALSALVAPATPDSIAYTQPPTGFADFYRRQRVMFWLLIAAFVAVGGFVGAVIWKGMLTEGLTHQHRVLDRLGEFEKELGRLEPAEEDAGTESDRSAVIEELERRNAELAQAVALLPEQSAVWPQDDIQLALMDANDRPTSTGNALDRIRAATAEMRRHLTLTMPKLGWPGILCDQLTDLLAAMLGAAFYTLYTANRYMVARTFDRAYTTHYIVRFVLGVVAGMILANFGEYLISEKLSGAATPGAVTLTQTLFALIGGYSADAVNAIFTRVAETLTTLVRGNPPKPEADDARKDKDEGKKP